MDVRKYLAGDDDDRFADEMTKRRDRILVAGALNIRKVLDHVGCTEQMTWHDGRKLANPNRKNPYRP